MKEQSLNKNINHHTRLFQGGVISVFTAEEAVFYMKEKIIISRFLTLSDNDPLEIGVESNEIKDYKEASNLVNLNVNGGVIFESPIKPKILNTTPLNEKEREEFREIWYGSYWNSQRK